MASLADTLGINLASGTTALDGFVDVAPPLVIEELTGTKRRIVLSDRALPYREVSFGQRLNTKLTRYPGNPVATQQVLAPEDKDTTIHGIWKDRFLPGCVTVDDDPNAVTTAQQLVDLINDVQRAANVLRVQWSTTVRSGLIKEFDPEIWRTAHDIRWSITFEWRSRNDEIAPRAAGEPDPTGVQKASNALDDALTFEPFPGMIPQLSAQVVSRIDSIRGLTGSVFDQIRAINDAVALPANALGALAALVDSLSTELRDEISRFVEFPAATQTAAQTVASRLQFESWKRDMAVQYASLRAEAISANDDTQTRFAPAPVRYVTVPADTTLYALSTTHYGTPDFAAYIARSNGSVIVPGAGPVGSIKAGTIIAIPPRPQSADAGAGCCGC